tara:strand:- start:2014 stop:4626 length:2613 start_codon:yes stop_codon:yes gene_type:complete
MKKLLSIFIGLLVVFSSQPFALAENLNSNHEQDLETWKESITDCVKDQNKDGFWIDVAIDESGSMATEDPQNKALEATFGLIEELSLKIDKFNNLEKEIYFNFYPFSTEITYAYSTGKPTTKAELESINPNSWTYTGGGTDFKNVFYYFLKNSTAGVENLVWTQISPLPPTYPDNSKDLNLCHVAIFLTDGGSYGYSKTAQQFLNQEHTFLLTAQIGSDSSFEDLKNNLTNSKTLGGPKNNAITLKIDDLDEIFTLWSEILDTIEDTILQNIEGAISVGDNVKIDICSAGTLPRSNEQCLYNFTLTAFADTYYITGGALSKSGSNANIDDLILRITPPDTNIGTEFDLGNRDQTTKNIKNVEVTVDPGRTKFSIKVDPQKNNFRDWVGEWSIEILLKSNSSINDRVAFIDQSVTGQVTTSLDGPDQAAPFKEVCYSISYKDSSGSIFSSTDYTAGEADFRVQNSNGKDINDSVVINPKDDGSYCFIFNDSVSNSDVYMKPLVKIFVESKAGEFEFPTTSEEKLIKVGNAPSQATLEGFIGKDYKETANTGVLENNDVYTITTENPETKIYIECSKSWNPEEEGNIEPQKNIRFVGKDIDVACGEEFTLVTPGSYEFGTNLTIDSIGNGAGILSYDVDVFDTTFNKRSLSSAEFTVLTYYVSTTSRIIYSLILLLSSLVGIFGLDISLKNIFKGFRFPANLRAVMFTMKKDESLEEFEKSFKSSSPMNLTGSKRIKSQTIHPITFYVKSGFKNANSIFVKGTGLVYKNDLQDPIDSISLKEFYELIVYSVGSSEECSGLVFVDDTFNPEAFDVARIYYLIASKLSSNNSSVEDKTETSFINVDVEETSPQKDKNVTDNPPEDAGDWEGMFD